VSVTFLTRFNRDRPTHEAQIPGRNLRFCLLNSKHDRNQQLRNNVESCTLRYLLITNELSVIDTETDTELSEGRVDLVVSLRLAGRLQVSHRALHVRMP
jgi:hypothetical protein